MNKPSLTNFFKDAFSGDDVAQTLARYKQLYNDGGGGSVERRRHEAAELNQSYYMLATDFYEYGWGESFHFGVRHRNENFADSLARHELYLAHRLNLAPGMKALDVGCGIGGPMRNIARFSGAAIVGINNSTYQLQRAEFYNGEARLEGLCELIACDWMDIPAPPNSYDAAYTIEATCIAGDRVRLFSEIHRVLKNDAYFTGYEYCMTSRYDASNAQHRQLKRDIEVGGGLPNLVSQSEVISSLKASGFEVEECRDLSSESDAETPWYLPLKGEGLSLQTFRQSPLGRLITERLLSILETLQIVPKGTTDVSQTLNLCADAMIRAGELGIFTPMLFFYAKKVS